MKKDSIDDSKLYELFCDDKKHKEDRRDQINSYYISLLTAVVGVVPFIDQLTHSVSAVDKGMIVRIFLSTLSLVGLVLAVTWCYNLKRILLHLELLDEHIEVLEKRLNINFISYINEQAALHNWPQRVTRYQIMLPYTFITIFVVTIIYSLSWLIL